MNTELQTFDFQSHQLNVILDDAGEPWFIAKQVAEILEYSDAHKMTSKLDGDEVQNRQIGGFGNRGVNLINESGLYSAILTSKKPAAKLFKRWVTREVLPSIRKTGGYGMEAPNVAMLQKMVDMQAAMLSMQQQMLLFYADRPTLQDQPAQTMLDWCQPRRWSFEEDAKADALRASGLGCTRIGYALNRSSDSVANRFNRRKMRAGAQ